MSTPTKLQALVTGELAGTWCVLINGHVHPQHPRKQELLPRGYSTDVRWSDGSVTDGVLKPVPIWYIETPDARVVVDTGFGDPEEVTRIRLAQGFPSMMRTRPEWHIPAALGQVGCRPEDVDAVILTHCHYDHVGGNELFTRASFYIHKNEIPLALAPPPWAAHYLPECARHLTSVREEARIVLPGHDWRLWDVHPGGRVI